MRSTDSRTTSSTVRHSTGSWRQGPAHGSAVRERIGVVLTDRSFETQVRGWLTPRDRSGDAPARRGRRLRRLLLLDPPRHEPRADPPPRHRPLLPNWRHLPVGYHGRAGTVVVSGTDIVRPHGLVATDDGPPRYEPTARCSTSSSRSARSSVSDPPSATDPDRPTSPSTSSGWCSSTTGAPATSRPSSTSHSALTSARASPRRSRRGSCRSPRSNRSSSTAPVRIRTAAAYLATEAPWGLDLQLRVDISSAAMRDGGAPPVGLSSVNFSTMYWTVAQQLAHLTANGASMRTGDLFGSGTVSGPTPGSEGSLIEMTSAATGRSSCRAANVAAFLADGDEITPARHVRDGDAADRLRRGARHGRAGDLRS